MKRNYDLRVLLRPYAEGDIIYLLDTASVKGKSRKLSAPWKGPALIVKKLYAYLYREKLRNAVSLYLACNDKNAFFLLLNNLNDIYCGHVRKCVMRSIIFWTIYL